GGKPCWVVHRDIGQHLAVQFHAGFFQAADELVITDAVQLGGSADAHNPDGTILALFLFTAAVGELQPALNRLFGGAIELGFCEEIATGALQYLLAALAALGTAFYARHSAPFCGRSLPAVCGWREGFCVYPFRSLCFASCLSAGNPGGLDCVPG